MQLGDAGISVAVAIGLMSLATQYPVLRYFMESLFRVSDVEGASILFIALGATVGQLIVAAVALITLRSVAPGVARSLVRPLLEALGAAILGGAASYGVLSFMGNLEPLTTTHAVFTQGVAAGMVGLTVAVGVLASLRNQEFRDLVVSLKRLRAKDLPPSGGAIVDGVVS
jgi:predicted membrane protein